MTNISRSKSSQTIKFRQLVEYNMRKYFVVWKLVPDPFLKRKNWAFLWINIIKFYRVCIYCMLSWGLSKYIETKVQTTCYYLTQKTFQRRFNVVFRLIWRRDFAQRQINVETTLCTSTLKFTTLNNVETTLCLSRLNWTALENVKTTLSFSTLIFTTLGNVETTLRIWPFEKKNKPRFKNKIIFLSLIIFLHHFKRN